MRLRSRESVTMGECERDYLEATSMRPLSLLDVLQAKKGTYDVDELIFIRVIIVG